MSTGNLVYSKALGKPMPYPKFLKEYILVNTDYMHNRTKRVSRFVSYYDIFEGKPIERIFGFICLSNKRTIENMLVKEVCRNYDHHQWLGGVYSSYFGGYKYPYYNTLDVFDIVKNKWHFNYLYHMYSPKQFLDNNDIKYSGWTDECELDFFEYITTYFENPKCELLMKAGLGYWTKYLKNLDLTKKSLHEIFKIKQECTPLLHNSRFGYRELMVCRKYGYTDMEEIITRIALSYHCKKERIINDYKYDEYIIDILKDDATFKYFVKYKFASCGRIYDYIDYLKELKQLGALSDPKALYPKQFKKAHREATKKIDIKESEKFIKGFTKSYNKYKQYEFKKGNLIIMAVKLPEQLYEESEKLDHCVRTYDEDVAKGKTEIMFIRQKDKPNKPYFTLELKGRKVKQVRGKNNKDPNEDVIKFVRTWSNKFNLKYNEKQEAYA